MCSPIFMVAGLLKFINRLYFSGFVFILLFENHSNKLAEQLSWELITFLDTIVALDTNGALSSG